jgi:hypothetical protein
MICGLFTVLLHSPKLRSSVVNSIFHLAINPASLCHLARHVVRRQLFVHTGGTSIISAVFKLHYPPVLQQYLLLSDVRRCDINSAPPYHYNCDIKFRGCATNFKAGKTRCCLARSEHFGDFDDDYSNIIIESERTYRSIIADAAGGFVVVLS